MSGQKPFVSPLLAQQQVYQPPPAPAPVVPSPPHHTEVERPLYDAPPWIAPEWFHPPVGEPEIWCDQCNFVIESRDTAVELFVGRVGRNWKNGLPMVVTDAGIAKDMQLSVLHIDCVEVWCHEIYGPNEPTGNICYGCGCEIEPLCEDCDARYKKDMEG